MERFERMSGSSLMVAERLEQLPGSLLSNRSLTRAARNRVPVPLCTRFLYDSPLALRPVDRKPMLPELPSRLKLIRRHRRRGFRGLNIVDLPTQLDSLHLKPGVHVHVVPGIDAATFQKIAGEAKAGCPISKALASVEIHLTATLK